jgi:hypothetical protein
VVLAEVAVPLSKVMPVVVLAEVAVSSSKVMVSKDTVVLVWAEVVVPSSGVMVVLVWTEVAVPSSGVTVVLVWGIEDVVNERPGEVLFFWWVTELSITSVAAVISETAVDVLMLKQRVSDFLHVTTTINFTLL